MNPRDKEIASTLVALLRSRIGEERYDLWLSDSRFLVAAGELTVFSADQFRLNRIRKDFADDIRACFTASGGKDITASGGKDITASGGKDITASGGKDSPVVFRVDENLASAHANTHAPSATLSSTTLPLQHAAPPQHTPAAQSRWARRRRFSKLQEFEVGDSNRLAYTSALLASQGSPTASPLFIYGPTGVGKTHLLEGIWSAVRQTAGARQVVYLSAEQFTSYFLEALHGQGLPMFRRKYRDAQVLIIDDVHFFQGKQATRIELLHTIDTLLRDGRSLVFSSDRSPSEFAEWGPELSTRMAGGLVCRLDPPEMQTRLQILRRQAKQRGFDINDRTLQVIAEQVSSDARRLSGALNRVQAVALAHGRRVPVDAVADIISDLATLGNAVVVMEDIDRAVCDVFGLDAKTLHSSQRSKAVSHPRMLAMWLARKYTRSALSEIGEHYGRRSHSTVISAQKKVSQWLSGGEQIQLARGACKIEDAVRRVETHLRSG